MDALATLDAARHLNDMFGLFKSKEEKLRAKHRALLKEARDLQRAGKIPEFAKKTAEAEAVLDEIDAMKTEG